MKQRDIERVMAAAWKAENRHGDTNDELWRLLDELDPHGLYRPGAPVPVDLEETQDLPLRDCPRLDGSSNTGAGYVETVTPVTSTSR